jgi:Outer membrane protein beta-barrel domain
MDIRRLRLSHQKSFVLVLFSLFCGLIASASAQSDFDRFTFSAGGGLGVGRSYVSAFVGNSLHGVAGAGINFNRLLGIDAEYMYYDLALRPSVSFNQSLPDASGNLQSISVNGIINVPRHLGKWGAYGIFGVGFYRRSVSARSQLLSPGTICQDAWVRWWDVNCINGAVQSPQTMSSNTRDAGGFNYGGGITYPIPRLHSKFFLEGRYHRAYQSDGKTIVLPITLGLRW